MLDILSRTLRAATRTESPHPPSATHYDMLLEHEHRKAEQLRTRNTYERRFEQRW